MTVRLQGSTSGFVELDSPAVGANNRLVLPSGNGTADQALVTNGSGTLSFADRGRMVLATAQNTTSGTSIDFTGIPSWVKRVTVMFSGVSTNGASNWLVQIGSSSGIESTNYLGSGTLFDSAVASTLFTSGYGIRSSGSSTVLNGSIALTLLGSNTWTAAGLLGSSNISGSYATSGVKGLSGALDRLRLTTVNGTDTFDAGSVNLLLEG
jgi:hypothetical protein